MAYDCLLYNLQSVNIVSVLRSGAWHGRFKSAISISAHGVAFPTVVRPIAGSGEVLLFTDRLEDKLAQRARSS